MHAQRSLVGIDQETIDQMFQSFDLISIPDQVFIDIKNISDKWLSSWMIAQSELKVLSINLKTTVSLKQKELIISDIQSGIIKCCIKDVALADKVEKFLLKALTFKTFTLSSEQRKILNIEILPKLRQEKRLWSSESMIDMICTLFSIQLIFETQYFDDIFLRTLTTAEKLNTGHEAKIARLDALMIDQKLVLQFGSEENPFKKASFLYNRISERVYKDVRYLDKPYQAKTLKAIYDADVIENKLENYAQLAERFENFSKKSVENGIGELNGIAEELGMDELICRTNKDLPEENFPYLNPNLYCKTIKKIKLERKKQIKDRIK